jgi:hypothetical protein
MREGVGVSVSTRRSVLKLAAGASVSAWFRLYGAGPDFWNKKPPADWSADEIQRLTTRSPWAREVTARSSGSEGGRAGGGMGGPQTGGGLGRPRIGIGMGGPRIGVGTGGPRVGGGGGGRRGGAVQYTGTVRWESAKPVLEALKRPLPEAFAGHYVISVNGFPMTFGQRRRSQAQGDEDRSRSPQDMLERLKAFTYLQPKGKALAQPGIVQQEQETGGGGLLFGFSKEILALKRGDQEVVFSTRLGRLEVKTKFNLKAMRYHGELAV